MVFLVSGFCFPSHKFYHRSSTNQTTTTQMKMNPSSETVNLSILSEPIHPIDERDLISLHPHALDDVAIERHIARQELKQTEHSSTSQIVWNDWDIPIGRSRNVREFVGNTRYRELVEKYRPSYLAVRKRKEKRDISVTIYNIIRSNGGRFLAPSGSRGESWYEISKDKALAKIGQALRIGVRPPQQLPSSSWTYPVEGRRPSHSAPPRPLFVNMPQKISEIYNGNPSDVADSISNVSFTSEDQLASSPFTSSMEFECNATAGNNQEMHGVQRQSSASFDPFPF